MIETLYLLCLLASPTTVDPKQQVTQEKLDQFKNGWESPDFSDEANSLIVNS